MKEIKRRKHSREFKRQAVELFLTGKCYRDLAEDLGISHSTLHEWKKEYLLDESNNPADLDKLPPIKIKQELERLQKENDKLKLHNEILKKAMGILIEQPPKSMP